MSELTHEEKGITIYLRDNGSCIDTIVAVVKSVREEAIFDTGRAVKTFLFEEVMEEKK